jgi:DNA-binding response OmpR family regulator
MMTSSVHAGSDASSERHRLLVLLYSDDAETRNTVRIGVGRRPAPDLPPVEWAECATAAAVLEIVTRGGLDLLVLDGEATPAGGMGLCKQLKDEVFHCPPVLLLTGRPQDAWLATWSQADHVVPHPLDPVTLAGAVAQLVRSRQTIAPEGDPS